MAIKTQYDAYLDRYLNINSAATTNDTLVRAGIGAITSICANNNLGTAAFLKIFSKDTVPVAGVDTPIMTIAIPANSTIEITTPIVCTLGVGIAITNLIGDLDNTAVGAGQVKVCLGFV